MSTVFFNTKLWDDEWVASLPPAAKLLFIFLWTNSKKAGNASCIYYLPLNIIIRKTGLTRESVECMLHDFPREKIQYDFNEGIVWVVNFVYWNYIKNRKEGRPIHHNFIASMKRALQELPDGHPFIKAFYIRYSDLVIEYPELQIEEAKTSMGTTLPPTHTIAERGLSEAALQKTIEETLTLIDFGRMDVLIPSRHHSIPYSNYKLPDEPSMVIPKTPSIEKIEKEESFPEDFMAWWTIYPKKENQIQALKEWKKMRKSSRETAMIFTQKAIHTERWLNGYAKTPDKFLKCRNYNDDISGYGRVIGVGVQPVLTPPDTLEEREKKQESKNRNGQTREPIKIGDITIGHTNEERE